MNSVTTQDMTTDVHVFIGRLVSRNPATAPAPKWGFYHAALMPMAPAAREMLESPYWSAKLGRALSQVASGQTRPLEDYLRDAG
jgi:hypothetical protein